MAQKVLKLFICLIVIGSCTKKDPVQYELTTSILPVDGGTVTPSSGLYKEGESVTITATPSSEYLFTGWSVGASGNTNPTTVVMNSMKTITANFEKRKYPLAITIDGDGTVKEEIVQTKSGTNYSSGTLVKLTAVPNKGSDFGGWSGDLAGQDNPKQFTMNQALTVKAKFSLMKVFRNYLDNSYNLRHTPLWIDHYSIPKQNGVNTQQDGYLKWYDSSGNIADFNNDGYYDIIFTPSWNDQVETRLPIEIYLNKGDNKTFSKASNSLITNNIGLITARKTLIGDFNGDGKPDAFFADHGIHTGFPGGIPALLLSSGNSYYFKLSDLPRGFYHTATSGDIDNDGDLDIFIPALENVNSKMSFSFLFNKGNGEFTGRDDLFKQERAVVSSELFDINKDGFLDLIIGDGNGQVRIFYGNGINFLSKPYVQLNQDDGNWGVGDFGFADLDKDGNKDIIILFSNGNGFKIRIFRQNSDHSFIEKTSEWIENSIGQNHSIVWIRVQDIDNNGLIDIIENDKGHYNSEEYSWSDVSGKTAARWVWNGSKFIKLQ